LTPWLVCSFCVTDSLPLDLQICLVASENNINKRYIIDTLKQQFPTRVLMLEPREPPIVTISLYSYLFSQLRVLQTKKVGKHCPTVNFINVLRTHFLCEIFAPKITKQNIFREKLLNLLSYEKRARKTLMKLTPKTF